MSSFVLPYYPRQAVLKSFWLIFALSFGTGFGVILAALKSPLWLGAGLLIGLIVAALGLVRPQAVRRPYRIWNAAGRRYAAGARFVLNGICFYLVILATGATLKLGRQPTSQSLWEPRAAMPRSSYFDQHNAAICNGASQSRGPAFLSWALSSGNWWALALVPTLMLLTLLDPDEKAGESPNLYTLY
jgi:hypothetical protein